MSAITSKDLGDALTEALREPSNATRYWYFDQMGKAPVMVIAWHLIRTAGALIVAGLRYRTET